MRRLSGTATQDLAGRRDAARRLLQRPIVTTRRDRETVELVQRHSAPLTAMFSDRLGYRLIVDPAFVRLVKAAPAPMSPPRVAVGDEYRFGAAAYTWFALVCAALSASDIEDRVSVPALFDRVRVDADTHGIDVGGNRAGRRRFVAALHLLERWGVVTPECGETITGDAGMLLVERDMLPCLLDAPLDEVRGSDAETPSAFQRLYRRLVEDPFVARAHLDDDMLTVLTRERAHLTRLLEEDFGLVLEVRTEGALAYDPAGALTDEPFPGPGALPQASLLLVAALIDRCETTPGAELPVDVVTVDEVLSELSAEHTRVWRREYVDDVTVLRRDVLDLLARTGLVRVEHDHVFLAAPAARYRLVPTEGNLR